VQDDASSPTSSAGNEENDQNHSHDLEVAGDGEQKEETEKGKQDKPKVVAVFREDLNHDGINPWISCPAISPCNKQLLALSPWDLN
jgi:hypothetical protein